MIGWSDFKLEHSKFWSNFEFDRNNLSGTGAWFNQQAASCLPHQRRSTYKSQAVKRSVMKIPAGHFKNTYELLNLRALKYSPADKTYIFNVWVRYFAWNFKGTLWNSTQNILLIHWKIWFSYNIEILRALRFKSSYAFLKRPPWGHINIKTIFPYTAILILKLRLSFIHTYIQ